MAEQTFTLLQAGYGANLQPTVRGWHLLGSDRILVNNDLTSSSNPTRYLAIIYITVDGHISLRFASDLTEAAAQAGDDLSDTFEASGSIEFSIGEHSFIASLAGADTSEPYAWFPTNVADVIAVFSAAPAADGAASGSLVIRDYVPVAPSFDDDTGDAISGTVDVAITSVTVPEADGTPTPTYAVHNSSLPAGLSFDTSTRVISGTPTSAGSGTITIRATNSAGTADWTVAYSISLPDADAPSASISGDSAVDEGVALSLSVTTTGGLYDSLAYSWSDGGAGGTFSAQTATPSYTLSSVTSNTSVVIACTVTASGTGTNAKSGTSDSVSVGHGVTVRNVPVLTSDTDSVWRLDDRDTAPSTPTGGTSTETYTPTGWTRTEPSPSETQAVWRSQRTRNFSDGSFTSAGAWQSPTRTADELLALNDIAVPSGRVLVGTGSLIEAGASEPYGTSSTTLAGDDPPNLGSDDLNPTRMWMASGGTRWRISDNGAGDIEAIFSAGGALEDYQVHIQPSFTDVVSLARDAINATPSNEARILWDMPDAEEDLLNGITDGDRWLFFITNAATADPLEGSLETGVPSTSGDLGTTNEAALAGSIETGVPSTSGDLGSATSAGLQGSVETGVPAASGDLTTTTEAGFAGSVETGPPSISGDLRTTTEAGFSGSVETGVPDTSGDLGTTNEAALEGSVDTGAPTTSGDLGTTTQAGFAGSVDTGAPTTSGGLSRSVAAMFGGDVGTGAPETSGDLSTTNEASLAGSIETGVPSTSGDLGSATSAGLQGSVSTSNPNTSGDLSITERLLLLNDWSAPDGENVIVHGLWSAGGSGAALYRSAANGGAQGSFLGGDRELQDGQSIERIRESGSLRFNDQPSGEDLEAFFTDGPAANGTIYLATIHGEWSASVTDVLASSGNHGNNVSFDVTGDFLTALQGLGTGDRFLLAITSPDTPLEGSLETGAPATSGSLRNTAAHSGSVETGAPTTSGDLGTTNEAALAGSVETGATTVSGSLSRAAHAGLQGDVSTGAPSASGDLGKSNIASLSGPVDTGAPSTTGDLSRSIPGASLSGSVATGAPSTSGDLSSTSEAGFSGTVSTGAVSTSGALSRSIPGASLEGSVETGAPATSGDLSESTEASLAGDTETGAPTLSGDLSTVLQSGLSGSTDTGAPSTTGDLGTSVQATLVGGVETGAPSTSGDLGQSNETSLEGSAETGAPSTLGNLGTSNEATLAGSIETGVPSTSGDLGAENISGISGSVETGAPTTTGDLTLMPGLNIYGSVRTGGVNTEGVISFTAPDVEVDPLELYQEDKPQSIQIVDLFPQKYKNVQAWVDFAEVVQEIVVEDVQDSIDRLLKITDPDEVDDDILPRMLKTLGFYLDLSTLADEATLRRMIKSLPYYYEKSGTEFFTNILDVFANTRLKLIPLYTNKDAPSFDLGTGNGSTTTFTGTLDEVPVVKGTVVVNVDGSAVDLDDDGEGMLSGTAGSGTINYETGAISVTFTNAPSASDAITVEYDTHAYQTFVAELPDGESLTHKGGNYYLTNHVDLEVLTRIDLTNEEITTLFYYIAPAVLVLNSLTTPVQLDNADLIIGAAFAISVSF